MIEDFALNGVVGSSGGQKTLYTEGLDDIAQEMRLHPMASLYRPFLYWGFVLIIIISFALFRKPAEGESYNNRLRTI